MDSQSFLKEMAFELGMEGQKLSPDFPIDVASWDSLAMFSIIGNIQRYFDVVVDAKQLLPCKTVGELLQLIASRQGQS